MFGKNFWHSDQKVRNAPDQAKYYYQNDFYFSKMSSRADWAAQSTYDRNWQPNIFDELLVELGTHIYFS